MSTLYIPTIPYNNFTLHISLEQQSNFRKNTQMIKAHVNVNLAGNVPRGKNLIFDDTWLTFLFFCNRNETMFSYRKVNARIKFIKL